jgi:hypothetical protein
MAFPRNTIIDYPEHFTKPDLSDAYAFYKTDVDQQKHMKHSTFKTFFVLRDEDTDIIANHEVQTGYKFKFGSAGEFRIYGDATDTFFDSVNPTGKTIFRYNTGTLGVPTMTNFVSFDPVNNSIATYGNAINYNGDASKGIAFLSDNKPIVLNQLNLDANIKAFDKNISYTGLINTGLEFDTGDNGIFSQNLSVTGQINANKIGQWSILCAGKASFENNIKLARDKFINESGANNEGLSFNASGGDLARFYGDLAVDGDISAIQGVTLGISGKLSSINTGDAISINGNCKIGTNKVFKVGAIAGITASIPLGSTTQIDVTGGIITGYS